LQSGSLAFAVLFVVNLIDEAIILIFITFGGYFFADAREKTWPWCSKSFLVHPFLWHVSILTGCPMTVR
jgi:hypothetical protein